jgi:hypothetical protein
MQHPPLAAAALRALERLERRSPAALAALAPQVHCLVSMCADSLVHVQIAKLTM